MNMNTTSTPIIPLQSEEDAYNSAMASKTKKIKKRKIVSSNAGADVLPLSAPTDSIAETEPASSLSMAQRPPELDFSSGGGEPMDTESPPFVNPPPKPSRKTFSRYTIMVKSVSCLAHLLSHMSEFYPIEASRYLNNFRYKHVNSKTSECECTFHSHLSKDELVDIFRQHSIPIIRESAETIRGVVPVQGKKKLSTQAEVGEDSGDDL